MARPLLTVALLGALGLVASACGDEPPSADEVAAIDSLVETELTVDEQRCILDGITRLEITASQILADELTAERDGELLATGTTAHLWVEAATNRPCRTPEVLRQGFRRLAGLIA